MIQETAQLGKMWDSEAMAEDRLVSSERMAGVKCDDSTSTTYEQQQMRLWPWMVNLPRNKGRI